MEDKKRNKNKCPKCGRFLSKSDVEQIAYSSLSAGYWHDYMVKFAQLRKENAELAGQVADMREKLEELQRYTHTLVTRSLWERIINRIDF